MGKYILQKQDYEDISFLINISKSIKDMYKELNKTENKFGNDSDEYKKNLERLKTLLNLENNIYNRLKNDFYKCEAIIEYLTNLKEYKTSNNSYDFLFDDTYDLEIARIIIKLNEYMLDRNYTLYTEFEDKSIKNQISKSINYTLKIFPVLQLDTLRCFLAIIKRENQTELSTYMKYKVSYLFPQIEKEFLNNNFEIVTNPYISAQLVTDLLSNNNSLLFNIRMSEFIEKFNDQIDEFVNYDDFDLQKPKIKNNLLLRIYFLRSLLIFIDSNTIDKIHGSINEYISAQFNEISNIKNILIFLNDCFEHQKEDVEIPKVLTLKKL